MKRSAPLAVLSITEMLNAEEGGERERERAVLLLSLLLVTGNVTTYKRRKSRALLHKKISDRSYILKSYHKSPSLERHFISIVFVVRLMNFFGLR